MRVTVLIVNDFLGGRLVRVEATSHEEKVSHYFNELQNGQRVDLTLAQFPAGTHFSQPEYRERVTLCRMPLLRRDIDI